MPSILKNRYVIGGGLVLVLILANIINYLLSGWGLITVQAHEMPLGQVIKSIERQGWVKIYTDLDLTTPVTMEVLKVPLPEAMATLCANVGSDRGDRGGGDRASTDRTAGGDRPPGGGGGGDRGGRGGGGFGGGAQWKLGFFAGPTSAQVKEEIHNFQTANTGTDTKIFSYPTPMDMLATDIDTPEPDPRLQSWPGYQAPPAPVAPPATDGQSNAAPIDPPAPPSTVSDYLNALAQQSNIWIMAPATWDTHVSSAPAPSSSISHAVKSLVGSAHGEVEQAIVLTSRRRSSGGGGRDGGLGGDATGWAYTEDRMRSAINGLPEDARPAALNQLTSEVNFMNALQKAAPDQRRALMLDHFKDRMGQNDWRRSPEKRAQRYARAVANRQAARGQ